MESVPLWLPQPTSPFPQEVLQNRVLDARIFHTELGSGVAILTGAHRFTLSANVSDLKLRRMPEVPGGPRHPRDSLQHPDVPPVPEPLRGRSSSQPEAVLFPGHRSAECTLVLDHAVPGPSGTHSSGRGT